MKEIRIVIAGHVDHGKSTLIGRLLSDTGQIFPERIEKVKNICAQSGKRFEFAFLLDALEEEQGQGITIDKTEILWKYKNKNFCIIDTPGHKEFLKNMISGASTADIALLMLDAQEGVQEQFHRHAYILGMLGIKNIVVVVNKMDLVHFDEAIFRRLHNEVLAIATKINIKISSVIPVSAFTGDNLLERSSQLSWYKGEPLADSIYQLEQPNSDVAKELRFTLQDVYKFDEKRIYVGKVEQGSLSVGDQITFLPSGSQSKIKSIEVWNVKQPIETVTTDTSVGFTLENPLFLERGEVGFKSNEKSPQLTHQMHVSLFWIGAKSLEVGKNYRLKMLTQESDCKIESIFNIFSSSDQAVSTGRELKTADAAEVVIKLKQPIVCDSFLDSQRTGRFVIMDEFHIVGGGIIVSPNTIHVFKESSLLSAKERSNRNGHKGAVLWLTGLSGSGKSTIAKELEKRFFDMNINAIVLDGDNLRRGINKDLGFSEEDRKENIRRTAEIAKLIAESGSMAIVALISPFANDRQMARAIINQTEFAEVFVNCTLDKCEQRDIKGLYKKARKGEIKNFTGIDSPYEAPTNPELIVYTDNTDVSNSAEEIMSYIIKKI